MSSKWPTIRFVHDPMRLHRQLRRRLHLPKSVADATVSAIRHLKSPTVARRRRRLANSLVGGAASPTLPTIDPKQGYCFFNAASYPGGEDALREARHAFDARRAKNELSDRAASAGKDFLVAVAEDEELLAYPSLARFMLSRGLINLATRYLATVPILSSARIFWSQANHTSVRSQLFHRDGEGKRQVKLFFNLGPVDDDSGPLTFIPAERSERALQMLGRSARRGKLLDSALKQCGVLADSQKLVGGMGSALALDTSRCLHYGSRKNLDERLLLMIQFTPLGAPRARIPQWGGALEPYLTELDEVQLLVLNRRRG